MCKGQQHELQWNTALQRNNSCSVTQYYFAFTLQETPEDYPLCHSYYCSWKWAFPSHFALPGADSKARVANTAGEYCLTLVITSGNLINAPVPFFALTCQTISQYHCISHCNERSDSLGTASSYAISPHITAWGIPAAFHSATALKNSSPPG